MFNFYISLIHAPVYTKHGEVGATSVTHIDIHDIARTAKTFGAKNYFIITPWQEQHEIVNKIIGYWDQDGVKSYHPDRSEAFEIIKLRHNVEEMIKEIEDAEGQKPYLICTGAKKRDEPPFCKSAAEIKKIINSVDFTRPVVLLLGTGWGLTEEIFKISDCVMDPIWGKGEYNHLSVRAASAILVDRLLN